MYGGGADAVGCGGKGGGERGEVAGRDEGNRREGVGGRNGDAKEDGHDFVSLGKPPPFHPPFLWTRLDAAWRSPRRSAGVRCPRAPHVARKRKKIGRASCRERVCQYV